MSLADFCLLSEIEEEVLDKIDQPLGEGGAIAFKQQEWVRAFNRAYQYIWARMSDQDRNWGLKIADVPVTAGSRVVSLTSITDMRGIRHVVGLGSSGDEAEEWSPGTFSDIGVVDNAYVYQKDQKQLYLLTDPGSATTLRIVYNYVPPPLAHGNVLVAGSTTTQLAAHEQARDGALIGATVYIIGSGPASGQSVTFTAWDGDTRTGTHAAYSVIPAIGDPYTTQPLLPIGAKDAFVYDCCAYMADKHQDDRLQLFLIEREKHLDALQREVVRTDKSGEVTVSDPLGFTQFGDPVLDY